MNQTSLNSKACFSLLRIGTDSQFGRASLFCFDFYREFSPLTERVGHDHQFGRAGRAGCVLWNWLHLATLTVRIATDSLFARLTVSAGTASGFVLGMSEKIGQEFPLINVLDSFPNSKVTRSISIILNHKNETGIRETSSDRPLVGINNKNNGHEEY